MCLQTYIYMLLLFSQDAERVGGGVSSESEVSAPAEDWPAAELQSKTVDFSLLLLQQWGLGWADLIVEKVINNYR